jgi:hypothetical protein
MSKTKNNGVGNLVVCRVCKQTKHVRKSRLNLRICGKCELTILNDYVSTRLKEAA